jgi:NADH-quinone oxidoreductase subunit N
MTTLIAIIALGIFCLVFEIFNFRKSIVPFTILGLASILGYNLMQTNLEPEGLFNNMIVTNTFSVAFSSLFIGLTLFLVALSAYNYNEQESKISDFVAIKIFLLSGAVAMVSFGNLSMFFLGIEVLSISLYILGASSRLDIKSNEAGMKYFLMGSFASAIILFGICMIYGAMGTFDCAEIAEMTNSAELPIWFPIGIALIVIGMLFKIAAVPFHFWAPDVYEGSPVLTTALMSTLAKVVAMATFFKLLSVFGVGTNPYISESIKTVIVILSVLSMTVGNIMALQQNNVKRMLAFSGISHAGVMLLSLLSLTTATGSLFYYCVAYALAGIAAFSVVILVCKNEKETLISNFNGLAKTHLTLAIVLTASLLSMAGIPVFAGFFAKLMLFNQSIQAGYTVVVVIAVINTIISIGYYFKLILAMFTKEPNESKVTIERPILVYAVAIVAIALNLVFGIFPSLILNLF